MEDRREDPTAYDGPDRRDVQYVTIEGFHNGAGRSIRSFKYALWGVAISIAGMIFAMGSFYGHALSAETEIRAALAATATDHNSFNDGITSISETMGSVVAEQEALRRDVERLRDGGS